MTFSFGLGRVASTFFTCSGLSWVGSHKMDPWTTLDHQLSIIHVKEKGVICIYDGSVLNNSDNVTFTKP